MAEAVALIKPQPIHKQMGKCPILERVAVAMENPIRNVDAGRRLKPVRVLPVVACQNDDLVNAFGICNT